MNFVRTSPDTATAHLGHANIGIAQITPIEHRSGEVFMRYRLGESWRSVLLTLAARALALAGALGIEVAAAVRCIRALATVALGPLAAAVRIKAARAAGCRRALAAVALHAWAAVRGTHVAWPHTLGRPPPPQASGAVHVPQEMVPPHPSATNPQLSPSQTAVEPSGWHVPVPHVLGPPPPHTCGAGQPPH